MNTIDVSHPSFTFGYWRPWNENVNIFDSYLNYVKDTSLVKYGADTVGSYISQASNKQIEAINNLGRDIGLIGNAIEVGMYDISNKLLNINDELVFLNRNVDILVEQNRLSNLLLKNITELLRVPNSEKERQYSIENGIKFFVNASKDPDLFADALEELLNAESIMKQDYFVLHRIGCIYLHVEKFLNLEKALDYFLRAAKYASVESDYKTIRLINILTSNFNTINSEINNSEKAIGLLAAESYEKAAFISYVLGRFNDAVGFQTKAFNFHPIPQNRFLLSKYQIRNSQISEGIINLSKSIDDSPIFAVASFREIDLINQKEVLDLIFEKNKVIDTKINELIEKWNKINSIKSTVISKDISELQGKTYDIRVSGFYNFDNLALQTINLIQETIAEIDTFILKIKSSSFCSFGPSFINQILIELKEIQNMPLEIMQESFNVIKKQVNNDIVKIGSNYAGGIVFYLDETGNHGLVISEVDFGISKWGVVGTQIGAYGNGIADGSGVDNTRKICEMASYELKDAFFTWQDKIKKPIVTAAKLCESSNHNGYSDWYLPTKNELFILYKNFYNFKIKLGHRDIMSSTEENLNEFFVFNTFYLNHNLFPFIEIDSIDLNFECFYSCYKNKTFWVRGVRKF
jgi:hypothetical protein